MKPLKSVKLAVRAASHTHAWLLDLPLLRDTDSNPSGSGLYVALSSTAVPWSSVLYESSDNASFAPLASSTTTANFGYAQNALAAPRSPYTWDTVNSLTIKMVVGSLAGDTDLNVLNGSNVLIAGGEVIQFANAAENEDGTYTVSRLLRGRRGTESACGSHAAGEAVIVPLAGGILRQPEPLSNIGCLQYYRAVSVGGNPSAVPSQEFTLAGNDLKPYAPCHVRGAFDAAGLVISWVRRTRIGGAWLNGIGRVPLSEESESYDVDVLTGSAVVRTFAALSSPAVTYTEAQQVADFGASQAAVTVNVYQNSASVGRGFVATATVG